MAEPEPLGSTRVARWKDDRKAAFLLMFDDSWPSHWQVAVPELLKRGMTATFYINPGKGEYKKFSGEWETNLWRQGMVYGNHTMTHQGATNVADADREITECNRAILRMVPGNEPRLISWGMPGVKTWNLTPVETQQLLEKNHLISRPDFKNHGAVYHLKTTAEMLALADRAIATNGMEYLVIHGVERIKPNWSYQDFWALKQDVFLPLLDALKERRDAGQLWITDHISMHKYATEQATAKVRVLDASERSLRLELTSAAAAQLYDAPLTLITAVPAAWQQCGIVQGTNRTVRLAAKGQLLFDAVPNGGTITLQPAVSR
ncbi:MAG: polysaccharide deacetylase family protein [Verrucomicrobiota bacterium]